VLALAGYALALRSAACLNVILMREICLANDTAGELVRFHENERAGQQHEEL
jgi:hypothetical protein